MVPSRVSIRIACATPSAGSMSARTGGVPAHLRMSSADALPLNCTASMTTGFLRYWLTVRSPVGSAGDGWDGADVAPHGTELSGVPRRATVRQVVARWLKPALPRVDDGAPHLRHHVPVHVLPQPGDVDLATVGGCAPDDCGLDDLPVGLTRRQWVVVDLS